MPYQMMVRCSNSVGLIWSRYHTTTDSIGRKCRWGCQVEIPHFHAVSSNGILIYKSPKTTAPGTKQQTQHCAESFLLVHNILFASFEVCPPKESIRGGSSVVSFCLFA